MVKLVRFSMTNAEKTFKWINDPDIRRDFIIKKTVTFEEHIDYCRKIETEESQHYFAIYFEDEYIGNAGLKNIDKDLSQAEAWIYIGEKAYKGRGFGKIAFKNLLRYANEKIGVKMIVLHVAGFNHIALEMYRNMGFIEIDMPSSEWKNNEVNIVAMKIDLCDVIYD